MIFKAYAPAKINLGLEIVSKRSDGYHELDMVMQSVDLFDEITIEKTQNNAISISHLKPIDCCEKDDITYKAADVFFKSSGQFCAGISIKVNKRIPVSAGLAGGSSDGAAVLVLLNHMYGKPFTQYELMKLGAEIGSDIPFCISGGTARATGTGTDLRFFEAFRNYFVVLVKPPISVSTKEAYRLSDSLKKDNIKNFDTLEKFLVESDFNGICSNLFNRFEDLVFNKKIISIIKKNMSGSGASAVLMSGSGPTVYSIFNEKSLAQKCYNRFIREYEDVFLCNPINYGVKII